MKISISGTEERTLTEIIIKSSSNNKLPSVKGHVNHLDIYITFSPGVTSEEITDSSWLQKDH